MQQTAWCVFDWRELAAGPLVVFRDGDAGLARARAWAAENLGEENAHIVPVTDRDERIFVHRHAARDAATAASAEAAARASGQLGLTFEEQVHSYSATDTTEAA
jgi:hypothetical protein